MAIIFISSIDIQGKCEDINCFYRNHFIEGEFNFEFLYPNTIYHPFFLELNYVTDFEDESNKNHIMRLEIQFKTRNGHPCHVFEELLDRYPNLKIEIYVWCEDGDSYECVGDNINSVNENIISSDILNPNLEKIIDENNLISVGDDVRVFDEGNLGFIAIKRSKNTVYDVDVREEGNVLLVGNYNQLSAESSLDMIKDNLNEGGNALFYKQNSHPEIYNAIKPFFREVNILDDSIVAFDYESH